MIEATTGPSDVVDRLALEAEAFGTVLVVRNCRGHRGVLVLVKLLEPNGLTVRESVMAGAPNPTCPWRYCSRART